LRLKEGPEAECEQTCEMRRGKAPLPSRSAAGPHGFDAGAANGPSEEEHDQAAADDAEFDQGLEIAVVAGLKGQCALEADAKRMVRDGGERPVPVFVPPREA